MSDEYGRCKVCDAATVQSQCGPCLAKEVRRLQSDKMVGIILDSLFSANGGGTVRGNTLILHNRDGEEVDFMDRREASYRIRKGLHSTFELPGASQ